MSDRPLRILIASPTPNGAQHMREILTQFTDFSIIGVAHDVLHLYEYAENRDPDCIVLSEKITYLAEFDMLQSLFVSLDIRWIVLAPRRSSGDRTRPPTTRKSDLFEMDSSVPPDRLAQQIRSVCRNKRQATAPPRPTSQTTGAQGLQDNLVLIGASTGGVDALIEVLSHFNETCPPTMIVQHTGRKFLASLTRLLQRNCAANVLPARHGLALKPGMVVVASEPDHHLGLSRRPPFTSRITPASGCGGHVPSVNALFTSAIPHAEKILAVILSGMGRDGADGMLALRQNGASTIAQDKSTSVVFGMPRVAHEIGAAQHLMPLQKIGPYIVSPRQIPQRTDVL